jgi:hypothetical protein
LGSFVVGGIGERAIRGKLVILDAGDTSKAK